MEHVRWLSRPNLRNPVVVAAFTGGNDAGDAASGGVRHLIEDRRAEAAKTYNASLVITLGARLADVPHPRPVQLIGTASDQAMIDRYDLQRSRYEGPTGIVGILQDACARADLPNASLWAAVPA